MIKLGSKVRDNIAGFRGIATAFTYYLHGCNQVCITPDKVGKDGNVIEGHWFDEQRIKIIKEMGPKVEDHSTARAGGPQATPPGRPRPKTSGRRS